MISQSVPIPALPYTVPIPAFPQTVFSEQFGQKRFWEKLQQLWPSQGTDAIWNDAFWNRDAICKRCIPDHQCNTSAIVNITSNTVRTVYHSEQSAIQTSLVGRVNLPWIMSHPAHSRWRSAMCCLPRWPHFGIACHFLSDVMVLRLSRWLQFGIVCHFLPDLMASFRSVPA